MCFGENSDAREFFGHGTRQWIKAADVFDFLVKQLNAKGQLIGVRGKDVNHIAPNPIGATLKIEIISGVLKLSQLTQNASLINDFTPREVHHHLEVRFWVTQAVDRRDSRHYETVGPLE